MLQENAKGILYGIVVGVIIAFVLSFILSLIFYQFHTSIAVILGGIVAAKFAENRKTALTIGLIVGLLFAIISSYGLYSTFNSSVSNSAIGYGQNTTGAPAAVNATINQITSGIGFVVVTLLIWSLIINTVLGGVGGYCGYYIFNRNKNLKSSKQ